MNILKALTRKFDLEPDLDLGELVDRAPMNFTGADFYALVCEPAVTQCTYAAAVTQCAAADIQCTCAAAVTQCTCAVTHCAVRHPMHC